MKSRKAFRALCRTSVKSKRYIISDFNLDLNSAVPPTYLVGAENKLF